MKIQITSRWSSDLKFECELEAEWDSKGLRAQRGEAIRRALKRGSNLRGSDLSGSNLRGSNLRGSDLSGSNLSGSNLRDSDLRGSNLRGSDLTPIRDDYWAVLAAAPAEVAGLREALIAGKVDGSTYEGECACLVGTIANVRHADYRMLGALLPNSSRPAERFFMAINKGDAPATNQASKIALDWTDEFLGNMRAAFGAMP